MKTIDRVVIGGVVVGTLGLAAAVYYAWVMLVIARSFGSEDPALLPAERMRLDHLVPDDAQSVGQTEFQIQVRCRYLYGGAPEVFWEGPFVVGSGQKAELMKWAQAWARTLQTFYAAKWSAEWKAPIYPVFIAVEVVRLRLGQVAAIDPVAPPYVDRVPGSQA